MARFGSAAAATVAVELPGMDVRRMVIRVIGDSPLIVHNWSKKAKEQMLAKQMKKAKAAKEAKNPEQDFKDSLYPMPDGKGYGFPSVAFKSAAVDACTHVDGITKVLARGAFHVLGDLVKITGEPKMREDMVRIDMGTADIRYRGEFNPWSADVPIRYNGRVLSPDQIVNLFDVAGFAIGVGEGRPERNGSWGMFHVAKEGE